MTRHILALGLAALISLVATAVNVLAAPTEVVLASNVKTVSARECAALHQGMANYKGMIGREMRAWGHSRSTSDCYIAQQTSQKASRVLAWVGCFNSSETQTLRSRLWPYPTLAKALMKYGLCYDYTTYQVTWVSCSVTTFIAYGAGNNYCGGAPSGPASTVAAEDDWYIYAYALSWWHQNHEVVDTWTPPFNLSASWK